jgi:hypothetical protein
MANARSAADAPTGTSVPRSALGWIGVLTGPIAWMIQLLTSWAFAEVVACAPATQATGDVLGIGVNAFLAIVNAVLLGLTAFSGVGSYIELHRIRAGGDPSPGDRATWLATAGVMTSILFTVLIAVSFVPAELIAGCPEAR